MASNSVQWLGPGFTANNAAAFAFKKGLSRGNTSLEYKYYQEPISQPNIFREWVTSGSLPPAPPKDFVTLTREQIISQFGVTAEDVATWSPTLNGRLVFSIEQSAAYPYLYRVNNCLLTPYSSNPKASFWSTSFDTNVNLLKSAIPFTYGNGGYKGVIRRTLETRELSNNGMDLVYSQQLAYVFDCETGVFTIYQDDNMSTAVSPISTATPPAMTCYIYKGGYGEFGWIKGATTVYLNDTNLQVLIGTRTASDPSLIMDVSGTAFIRDIVTQSVSTSSDRRLKENIRDYVVPKGILNLTPRLYNYIAKPGAIELGMIAQEVEELVPEIIRENGGTKSLQYDRLGVLLLPIVKEQEERIKRMESEILELKELVVAMMLKQGVSVRRSSTTSSVTRTGP